MSGGGGGGGGEGMGWWLVAVQLFIIQEITGRSRLIVKYRKIIWVQLII